MTSTTPGVGMTILDQLARSGDRVGAGMLRAMVGATHIVALEAGSTNEKSVPLGSVGVGFKFRGCRKWNGIEVYLDGGSDSYILRFYRMNLKGGVGAVPTLGEWMSEIYAEDLATVFTKETGLDTRL